MALWISRVVAADGSLAILPGRMLSVDQIDTVGLVFGIHEALGGLAGTIQTVSAPKPADGQAEEDETEDDRGGDKYFHDVSRSSHVIGAGLRNPGFSFR